MFPITDQSETIVHCLMHEAEAQGVKLCTERGVLDCEKQEERFRLTLSNGETLFCDRLLVATGGNPMSCAWLEKLGHTLVPAVPSLFTFNIPNSPLNELAGVSVAKVHLAIEDSDLHQTGPLLITHWGFSGPAVLKLSAWGARFLHDRQYRAILRVDWLPEHSDEDLKHLLMNYRKEYPSRLVASESPCALPKNLWKALLDMAGIPRELRWSIFSKQHLQQIVQKLHSSTFQIDGKSTYKDEFVTCGGVKLQEVNFKTMESRICPGLHFAGEVLDIDGITGGFNFQNAWTTSWLAGRAMAEAL